MLKTYSIIIGIALAAGITFVTLPKKINIQEFQNFKFPLEQEINQQKINQKEQEEEIKITHIQTPQIIKGLYVNFYSFQSENKLSKILSIVEKNDINSLVIDIRSNNNQLFDINEKKVKKILSQLHQKNIYLIARIVAFKNKEDEWYDPASLERWGQIALISKSAYDLGFDEINYDYIRYPGPNEPQNKTPIEKRQQVIKSFFEFLNKEVRQKYNIPISADIFGVTFVNPQSQIGQRIEDVVSNFDYIMPMPYPSHWAKGSFGISHPGDETYQVVYKGLVSGWEKVKDNPNRIAKLRSWIQAFGIRSISPWEIRQYTKKDIENQIKACLDAGCEGWVLWNGFSDYQTYF